MSKKRILCLFLSLAMVFGLFLGFASAAEGDVTLQILATSDLHAKFYNYDYALNEASDGGSMLQIASAVKELKNDNTLLIDAGDTIQGNASELFLKGENPIVKGLNEMGYDIWVPGNHEFNYGVPVYQSLMGQFKGKALLGNVYDKSDKPLADAYTIVEKGGVKIGVIGMVTPNITRWDAANLKEYKVTDPVEETKKAIAEIKDKVDLIVAVEHMSEQSEYGVEGSGAYDVIDANPEIDVFIAAHEHKLVEGLEYKGTLIVENKDLAQTMAVVTVVMQKGADRPYVVKEKSAKSITTADYKPDADLQKALAPFDATARKDAETVIGKLEGGPLVAEPEVKGIPQAQIADSALIDLINTVQMHYTGAKVSGAALFLEDANMQPGDIQKSDTSLVYKYTNTLYKIEMTGKQLKDYMEWTADYFQGYQDGDLTIAFNPEFRLYNFDMFSGINYEINIGKPVGSRIENLTWPDGTPVKDEESFTVALNNYRVNSHLMSGTIYGEGNPTPKILEIDVKGEVGGVRELIGDYIVNVKKGVITPDVDNNWKITGADWDEAQHAAAVKAINEGKIEVPRSEDGRTPNIKAITVADLEAAGGAPAAESTVTTEKVEEATVEVPMGVYKAA